MEPTLFPVSGPCPQCKSVQWVECETKAGAPRHFRCSRCGSQWYVLTTAGVANRQSTVEARPILHVRDAGGKYATAEYAGRAAMCKSAAGKSGSGTRSWCRSAPLTGTTYMDSSGTRTSATGVVADRSYTGMPHTSCAKAAPTNTPTASEVSFEGTGERRQQQGSGEHHMSAAMQDIEERLPALSFQERLLLIERLAQTLRGEDESWRRELDGIGDDPDIQREIREIDQEFAVALEDGLQGL